MKKKFRNYITGFLLALQFFTTIPVKKEIAMEKEHLKHAVFSLPLLGIFIGMLQAFTFILNDRWLQLPMTVIALFIVTVPLILTGGIHLDGWMDASDAFFSYRDKEKRLQIMDDPRTGSFAVLSVLFLLAWRYIFVFETMKRATVTTVILIVAVYYFARLSMSVLFIYSHPAKTDGLAAFFKRGLERKDLIIHFIFVLIFIIIVAYIHVPAFYYVLILLFVTLGFAAFSKTFIEKQFGGITGDTLGATLEGGETVLWGVLWLLHLFVMELQ